MKDGSKDVYRIAFRTALRRGAFTLKYRFTYRTNYFGTDYGKPTILWHDGKRTMVSKNEPVRFKDEESLNMASAGLTGSSLSTAHIIPALIMPELINGRQITEISVLIPLSEEMLEKKMCYRLDGRYADNKTKITLWIEKDTLLILKIFQHYISNGELRAQTISYTPIMNGEIPGRLLDKQVKGEWEFLETER